MSTIFFVKKEVKSFAMILLNIMSEKGGGGFGALRTVEI